MAKKKYYYAAYSYTDKEGRFTKATMTGITTGDGKIVSGIIKCAAKRLDGYADSRTIQVDNVIQRIQSAPTRATIPSRTICQPMTR